MSDIIAIGGGGFGAGNAQGLDTYLLDQVGDDPRIGFIPTATGDSDPYVVRFYERYTALACRPSHLPLFRRTPEVQAWVEAQDVIFVGGGNTKSMLAVWADWGLDDLLRDAAGSGTVMAGVSAGAICWFEQGVTDSWAGELKHLDCLGIVPGSCCPHYFREEDRRPTFERMVASEAMSAGVAIDDGAAVHLRKGKPYRVVVAEAERSAYWVSKGDDGVTTTPIPDVEEVRVLR